MRPKLPIPWLRSCGAALAFAFAIFLGQQNPARAADANLGTADAPAEPSGFPYVMRPGDVLVNAPLGVRRTPAPDAVARLFVSTPLGVIRTPTPMPANPVFFASPLLGVGRGGAIRSIEPDTLEIGVTSQVVAILGTGLDATTSVNFEPAENVSIVSFTVEGSGGRIDVVVDVEADAQPGLRRMRILGAGGRPIPEAVPGASQVLLAAGLPHIDSVVPNLLERGAGYSLEIRGSNLRGLPWGQTGEFVDQPIVRVTPVDGFTIGSNPVANQDGTLVTVPVHVDGSAPLVDRLVQVVTESGSSTAVASPANTLRLSDSPLHALSPFVSVPLGVRRNAPGVVIDRFMTSATLGVSRGPAITSLEPEEISPGDAVRLRLQGRGLSGMTEITLAPADGIAIDMTSFIASDTEIAVDIAVSTDVPLLPRRVTARNATTAVDAPALLFVRDAAPELHAVTPTYLLRDDSSQAFLLQGTHLGQAVAASVIPDTDLVLESFTVLDDAHARFVMRASPGAASGPRVITVSSPSGSSSAVPSPANTIHVADRTEVLTPFVSPVLGVRRGEPPVSTRDVFLASPVLGVSRGRVATDVAPARIARGTTTRITVHGHQLAGVDAVGIVAADGIAIADITPSADGTSVAFDVDVAVDAATGHRRITASAAGVPVPFSPTGAALVTIDDNIVAGPVAEPDTYAVVTNLPLSVGADQGVLANDHDPQGGTMYAVLRRLPMFGTVSLAADGGFLYTPNEDFVGLDRFEYSAGSGALVGASAIVTLNVAQIHDAVDDHYTTNDNQPLDVPATLGLLTNDIIAAGATVTVELASSPALGQLTLAADGGFRYVPNGTAGTDRFRYRIVADGVRSAAAEVTIAVIDFNEAPVAVDDHYAVDQGSTLVVHAPGVLRNDSDPDGDPLTARAVSSPVVGTLVFQASGGFTYAPPAGFTGQVNFIYEISDPRGLRAQAAVTINVNDHLAPAPDAYSLNEGEVLFVDAPGVLGNDSIIPQGALRVVVVEQPDHGSVQMANDGSFVYTPQSTDINGIDIFRYRLEDAATVSYAVDVRLTIHAVNDPPRVSDDRYLTDENVELSIAAPGVLGNDSDIDSTGLTARLVTPPVHGNVVLRANGSLSYVPETNYRGTDSFTYEAVDTEGAATAGVVRIDITQPPTPTNDVYLVDVDTTLEITDPLEGLLVNDHDAPEDDDLSAVMGAPPEHGTVALAADGTFTYSPNPGYQGIDTFTYQVTDGRSLSNFGNVTLAVGVTSLPRANPDTYAMDEDQELVVDAIDGVLANDTDADTPHEQLEAYIVGYDYWNIQSVTLEDDGSFRFRPATNFTGETYFVYQVYDGTSVSNAAMVHITVGPVNDGVIAEDDQYGVRRNTIFEPTGRPISYNDRYDGDYPVNFEVAVPPQHGTIELNAVTGHFRYTPPQDFAGTDTFTYHVFQIATGIGDTAVVTLRTNGAPVANPDVYTVVEDSVENVTPSPLANDSDPDGDLPRLVRRDFRDGNGYGEVVVDDETHPTVTTVTTSRHFYGSLPIRYTIDDGTEQSFSTITLTVTPVPEAPIAANDDYITPRNTPLVVTTTAQSVLYNDFDPDTRPHPNGPVWEAATGVDLLPITAQLVTPPAHGALVLGPVGTFTYTPDTDYSGSDSFVYRAIDATGRASAPATARIRVNTPPAAADDAYAVIEDVPLVVTATEGLLANDSDIDGDALHAAVANPGAGCAPCNGRIEIRADGGFRYTPNANYFGQDEFYYTVRDGVAGSDVGHVSLTVLPVNDAPYTEPDTYRTREDEVLVAPEPQGILRNDREVDGEQLVDAQLIEPPNRGAVVVMPDGSFTYTPQVDLNGRDTFRYRVHDESGLYSDEDVEVLVTPVNDPPHAQDDSYATDQDEILAVPAEEGVLANDHDVDGPQMTASLIGLPQHGQVDLQADGSFIYEPDGIFTGVDRFQYQVDDGLGAVAVGVAAIVVRPVDPTVIITVEDDLFGFEGPSVTIAAPGVLANDAVAGAPSLVASLVIAPDVGAVQLDADGGFRYTAPAGYSGLTGFTYAASAAGVSELARVTLDVRRTDNVPPVAVGEQFGMLEDHILDSHSSGSLLANDSDHENAPLTLVVDSVPEHGSFTARSDGHFVYAPVRDYNGSDRIIYRVSDGERLSEPATATIIVFAQNDAPVANDDLYRVTRDTPLTVTATLGLLANDHDVDGDALDVELVDAPQHGQTQVNVDGSFVFTPAPGYVGGDLFRYAATDGLARDVAEVTLTVAAAPNRPPVATGEVFSIDEDSVLHSDQVGSLLANDSDPDGDPLHVNIVEMPAHGTLEIDGDRFAYAPSANFFGSDAFRYSVTDGELSSDAVAATIEVRPVNDVPVAVTDLYAVVQGSTLTVEAGEGVLANDFDVDGQSLSAQLASAPAHGVLDLRADGGFGYVPLAGFNGRDEFSYRSSDGEAATIGRAVIDVTPAPNQRPLAIGEVFAIAEDSVLDTRALESLLANDHDPEGMPLTLVMPTPPPAGTLEVFPDGHIRYVPERDAVGDVVMPYTVSDGVLESEAVEVRITLLPVQDPPYAQSDLYLLAPDQSVLAVDAAAGVLANDLDVDGDALVAELVRTPAHGTLDLGLDGSFIYRPGTPRPASDGFRYRARDSANQAAEAEVVIDLGGDSASDPIFTNGFETP